MVIPHHKWESWEQNQKKKGGGGGGGGGAILKVKVTGIIESKHDCYYHIFWIVDPFATKISLMVHKHKLEYLVKR